VWMRWRAVRKPILQQLRSWLQPSPVKKARKRKEVIVAKVIEFYIPKNFRKPSKRSPESQCGKIIEFCTQFKKSA